MGLKNYNEQINLIRQADSQIAYLNTYANSMNALIISLGSLWDDNVDQSYMLNAIGNCVHIASEIAYDYSVFSANSIKWLNNMDNLEKLVRALIPGKDLKVKPFRSDYDTSPGTQKDRIRVNPDDLSDFATQVDGYTKRLEAIHVKTSGLNKQIDNLIISKFASNYSLNGINRRIVKLKNINSNIATALRKIADAYRKTENELKGMVNALELGADSTGNLNPQVEKTTVAGKGKTGNKVQTASIVSQIIKSIKKSKTVDIAIDDLKDALGVDSQIEDVVDILKKLENGEYVDAAEKIGDKVIGSLYDKETGTFSDKAVKAKALAITAKLVVQNDSYLMKNYDKYMNDNKATDLLLKGHFYEMSSNVVAGIVQVLGKGTVDAGCRLVDSLIQVTPAGKVLNYVNAVSEDMFGTSPGRIFNQVTKVISDGVDTASDNFVKHAGKLDKLRQQGEKELKKLYSKVVHPRARSIKQGINCYAGGGSGGGGGSVW